MFETDKYDRKFHLDAPTFPRLSYDHVDNIEGMSFLLWAEHCVECAAPSCYKSCDLYQPRTDWRCRRFAFGMYKNRAFHSARGYGAELRFKKWAKLETFGNSAIHPLSTVLRLERSLEHAAAVGNLVGTIAHRVRSGSKLEQVTYISLDKLSRAFHRRHQHHPEPQAFLLEVYNPEAHDVALQIIFSIAHDDLHNGRSQEGAVTPHITTIVLPSGYSQNRFDAVVFRPFLDRDLPFKITIVPEAESYAHLVFLTADLVTFKRNPIQSRSAEAAEQVKCVVWDLDNTIWNGTLVEGDELSIRPGIIEMLRYFDERGIIMSIASKNDADAALERLKHFGIRDYFLYPQVDWLPKSHKIKKISQQLNIGLDSIAFIDDNPFELAEVSAVLPQVFCIDVEMLKQLSSGPRFQANVTEESRQRRRYYQQQIAREIEQTSFEGDYTGFLRSCKIVLDITQYQPSDEERVAELVQRTNQLNFSGQKYSRAQLEEMIRNPVYDKYVLRCSDRYGAYGAVGFCIFQEMEQELRVSDFMLSCRVQGKFIEHALFAHLISKHNRYGASSLWVNFHATDRNTPARQVLESLGFEPGESKGGGLILRQCERLSCNFIEVDCTADNHAEPVKKVV